MSEQDPASASMAMFLRTAGGDHEAAEQLFEAYVGRLIALAHTRLSEKLRQRVDAEDIVQSVFRSFFVRAQAGQYTIGQGGDLWRLLAAITRNKVLKKAEHHRQQRRSLAREEPGEGQVEEYAAAGVEPTEFEAIQLADEVSAISEQLDEPRQKVLELRLQGKSIPEISTDLARSERTIRRYLEELRSLLESRLLESPQR